MSIRNLERMLRPRSIAVFGASDRVGSVGAVVYRNLLQAQFQGPIWPVNPKHATVAGNRVYPDAKSLPEAPDLAVIATPPATVPELIAALAARGTRAAVVLTAGLSRIRRNDGRTLQQAMLDTARQTTFRLLGPNCLGLLVPGIGLNASFAHVGAQAGGIAFISQSGALCTAVLDWALARDIGFSHFISVGDSADVDFGDLIDYLGADPGTRSILLYIEAVGHARKFLSATRAAARNKPIVAIRGGRVKEGASAAASHTGALAGSDDAYDAAFRRAGILRVYDIDGLFDAVETLAHLKPLKGERLAIMTNGGGPGVLATDALIAGGGQLASLSEATVSVLDDALPENWSRSNPVDIIGDAPSERYGVTAAALVADPEIDALLAMHSPTAVASSSAAAQAVIDNVRTTAKNVLTCWLGSGTVADARSRFGAAGIPSYDTPDAAVRAFLYMVRHRRRQAELMEVPPSLPTTFSPDTEAARGIVREALASGRAMLSEVEAKQLLSAYAIPVVRTLLATDVAAAVAHADAIGYPVALKINSPDISHKSDVGGVALNLEDGAAVRNSAEAMVRRVRSYASDARISGFSVQAMASRPGAYELILGVATDPIFGPIILFGQGGKAVELIGDKAVALPPLNMGLAADLVARTRISRLLAGYRDEPPIDLQELHLTLVKLSQLVVDLPEIVELDINPLFADARGVLALDARVRLEPRRGDRLSRLAIRPYPREHEERIRLASGREVVLRPIRPEDAPAYIAFISRLNPQDVRLRFFGMVRELPLSQLARLTQIDYDREMAFIAMVPAADGGEEALGVVRTATDPDNQKAEFAIVVRSDVKRQGLGRALMNKMIGYCRSRGTGVMVGDILHENAGMQALARAFGFRVVRTDEDVVQVELPLDTGQVGYAR